MTEDNATWTNPTIDDILHDRVPDYSEPAPEPGFVQTVYVIPQYGRGWLATWAIGGTQYEEFVGTRTACLQWALARCHNVRLFSHMTQDVYSIDSASV
jgi:hypothetical protein